MCLCVHTYIWPSTTNVVHQVREECGFDVTPYLKPGDYVDVVMKEQSVRLYICHGVPQDTVFETQTRKEISVSRCGLARSTSCSYGRKSRGFHSKNSQHTAEIPAVLRAMDRSISSTIWWHHFLDPCVNGSRRTGLSRRYSSNSNNRE